MNALVLAGGLGTRLRTTVPDRPKALAEINGEPFIRLLLRRLSALGVTRVVLCLGHQARQIIDYVAGHDHPGLHVQFEVESSPLGTAGSIRNAAPLLGGGAELLVLNGDTFLHFDAGELVGQHRRRRALATVCVWRSDDATGKGIVRFDEDDRLISYAEKTGGGSGWVNAGVYVLHKAVLERIPAGRPSSLEREVLPALLADSERVWAHRCAGPFIDIGTPSDYIRAQTLLAPYAWNPSR